MDGMIAQTIQLALAPVFVLVAIASIMNPLTSRLGRVVDRSRELQYRHSQTQGEEHDDIVREARSLDLRIDLIGRAILLLVVSGLFIGMTVVLLFIQEFAGIGATGIAAGAFMIAVSLLMWALLTFLRETREATRTLRIPEMYLEKDREL